MNKRIHRLVLDRRRGMLVPAAENTRSAGKAASGSSRSPSVAVSALLAAGLAAVAASGGDAQAAPGIRRSASVSVTTTLPQAATPGNPLAGGRTWVQTGTGLGTATMYVDGKLVSNPSGGATPEGALMMIRQTGLKAILNWDSFNIGVGKAVEFRHDSASASTLNYIWSADPSVIRGKISSTSGDDGKGAGGEVILQNTNGVIFANGARVDTGRFVATALSLSQDTFLKGLRNVTDASVVFGSNDENNKGFVLLEQGAEIRTAAGGDVLLIAPRVLNEGRIETPSGQTVMAAGQKVYMATSQDATQRGLVVAVSPFAADGTDDINSIEQAKAQTYQTTDSTGALVDHVNAIVAEKGRINLVGLSIKQNGLLSATNAVQGLNGAIYLQAMGGANPSNPVVTSAGSTAYLPQVTGGGSVTFGAGSVTEVRPDSDESNKQVAAATFTKAKVSVSGGQILLQSGATISAKSGVVSIVAAARQEDSHSTDLTSGGEKSSASSAADTSRVVVQSGATIDVSGVMDYLLPMSSNYLDAKLFSIELAKAPLQRVGVLYQKSITFDVRQSVVVADVSGALANVKHSALELSTTGGTVDIRSDGVLATEAGSTINFAGGSIKYADGFKTISLLRKGDTYVDVNHAKANVVYDELVQSRSLRKELGYTDGKNAGNATFVAPLTSLQGQLNGSVVTGVRQRNDGMEGASALPLAGTVTIGRASRVEGLKSDVASNYANTQIVFNVPSTGASPSGSWLLDPLNGSTAGAVSQVNLSSGMFMSAGIGNLNLYADQIVFNGGQQLDLGTKGSLLAFGSSVNFNGDVRAAGGSITLAAQAGQLALGELARLTVAGAWSNDRVDGVGSKPLALDGGAVSLLAAGSVNTAAGSVVDASAGAWSNAQGAIKKGAAGSITAATNADLSSSTSADTLLYKDLSVPPTGELNLRGRLQAYGFASGGALVLQGNHVGIGQKLVTGLNLDPATFFSSGGFGDITVRSFGSFNVAAGSTVQAQLASAVLNTNALSRGGSQTVAPVVSYAPLADVSQRKAVNITLAAQQPMTAVGNGANVEIGEGALIQTEAGGKIKLSATGSVNVAGRLVAQGGSIALEIKGKRGVSSSDVNAIDDLIGQLDPTQGIWLTSTALLDVHGTAKTYQDALGRNVGSVLGGGTVSLTANRGYVVAQKGSVIDLGGASLGNVLLSGQNVAQTVTQAAGTLSLITPEGFALEGSINARGPVGADMGGTLNAAITLGSRVFTLSYPTDNRQILLTTSTAAPASASDVKPGANLKDVLGNGAGTLSSNVWQDAGFAEMNLAADDSIGFSGNMKDANAVQASRAITLDTRAVTATKDSKVQLKAASVTLGNVSRDVQADTNKPYDTAAVPATPGSITTLEVEAGLIDLAGTFGLQGWSDVALLATRANDGSMSRTNGEIRLRGKAPYTGTALTGSLNFAGTLSLQAGQIYADTLTAYTINGNEGSLFMTFLPAGGSSSAAPLSALGSLTVNASTINHGGQIVQPFGAIAFNADNVNLWANSLLSVSGEGLTVPVGTTVNQASWFYSALGSAEGTVNASTALNGLPVSKQITLNGKSQTTDKTARVTAAGGGDLQAWEFISGVGGPTDYLAGKDLYAIIPNYQYEYAPYDAEVMSGNTKLGSSTPAVGKQVVISQAAGGLAAGTYTLLPARYALLKGAYLVSLSTEAAKTTLRGPQANEDGSVVTTGYFTSAGTSTPGASGQRLVVQPADTYLAKAQYATSSVNSLLQTQASRAGNARPTLPEDAGRVTVEAANAFALQAQIDLSAKVAGARAGQFDIAAAQIAVVGSAEQSSEALKAQFAAVSADTLNKMNAASVLLGGTRSVSGSDTRVVVVATDARIEATSTPLALNELIVVGKYTVTVDANAQLKATGATDGSARTLSLNGDAALLAVTNSIGTLVDHTGIKRDTGTLTIQPGVSMDAPGVLMDASRKLALDPGVNFKSLTSLAVAGNQLALGSPTDGSTLASDATLIDGSLLANLKTLASLSLRSYTSIDLYGDQQFTSVSALDGSPTMQYLLMDAPTVRGMSGGNSAFAARQVVLQNSSGQAPASTLTGSGSVTVSARPTLSPLATGGLTVGDGAQSWAFDNVTLASSGDLIWSGAGVFTAQSDLTLQAARVTASKLADKQINGGNTLTVLAAPEGAHTLGEQVGQGGKLAFNAKTILQQGLIDVSTGQLAFTASGTADDADSLVFDAGSRTQAQGFAVQTTADNTFYANGGSIKAHAARGNVVVKGALDVSAPAGGGDAGTLSLVADGAVGAAGGLVKLGDAAKLLGTASKGQGGQFVLDASGVRSMGQADTGNDMDSLLSKVAAGGFQREIDLRVRAGDINVAQNVSAQRFFMSADQGSIALNGDIDARAADGGVVQVMAFQDLSLNGHIDTRSTRIGANGGDVLLGSDTGTVTVGANASVDASSTTDTAEALAGGSGHGRVILRARRDDSGEGLPVKVAIQAGPAQALRAGEVTVEAVKVYGEDTTYTSLVAGAGSGSKLGQSVIENDLAGFADTADAVRASLFGSNATANQHVRAGYEIRSTGNFTIADTWNLQNAAHSGAALDPINLTIRAAGGLAIEASVSDGFDVATAYNGTAAALIQANDGASYRLVAGADLSAANLLATSSKVNAGNLTVGGGKAIGSTIVRTTSGSIELAAAGDIRLKAGTVTVPAKTSQAWQEAAKQGVVTDADYINYYTNVVDNMPATVYAAGKLTKVNVPSLLDPLVNQQSVVDGTTGLTVQYTGLGGRVEAKAGRDVVNEAPARQQVSSWLTRSSQGGTLYYFDQDTGEYVQQYTTPHLDASSGLPLENPDNYLFDGEQRGMGWWTNFAAYRGSFGSFGGGSILLTAGGNVDSVQVAAPTSARQLTPFGKSESGVIAVDATQMSIENGGNLTVRAGGDIKGGSYFVASGDGVLDAKGAITDGTPVSVALNPMLSIKDDGTGKAVTMLQGPTATSLSLMDGTWSLQATGEVKIAGVSNPTVLSVAGASFGADGSQAAQADISRTWSFLSYSPTSAVNVVSVASDVVWEDFSYTDKLVALLANSAMPVGQRYESNGTSVNAKLLGFYGGSAQAKLTALATPIVRAGALGGDLSLVLNDNGLTLAPSVQGDLDLYASGNVTLKGGPLVVSDVDPTRMPTIDKPAPGQINNFDNSEKAASVPIAADEIQIGGFITNTAIGESRTHDAIHANSTQTVSIVAGGNINDVGGMGIDVPMAATIEAGQDIINLNYHGEQFNESDITRIAAGRNFTEPSTTVLKSANTLAIKLGGAGLLDVSAGRQFDLGDSAGVQTFGTEFSANLPASGASIKASAGTDASLNWAVFSARYLQASQGYASAADAAANNASLQAFVAKAMNLDASQLTLEQAKTYFQAMKPATQTQFAKRVMAAEFGATYLTESGNTALLSNWVSNFKAALRVDDAILATLAADDPVLAIYNKAMADTFGSTTPSASAVGYYAGWQQAVARSLGYSVAEIEKAGAGSALYQSYQAALSTFSGPVYERYRDAVLMGEVQRAGTLTAVVAQKSLRTPLFSLAFAAADKASVGESLSSVGDLNLTASTVQTHTGGDVSLYAPGGDINVGLSRAVSDPPGFTLGVLTYQGGDINAFVSKEFQVNSSRVITVGTGDLTIWSSDGNIDSGKGANTDVVIPPPRLVVAKDGSVSFVSDAVTSGKGLQAAGTAYLVAPRGEVRAQDAFVKAGANLIVSAQAILAPAGNLQAASTSGVVAAPAAPTLVAPSTPVAADATAAGVANAQAGNGQAKDRKGMLTVDLLGLGDAPGAGAADSGDTDDDKPCGKDDPRAKCQNLSK